MEIVVGKTAGFCYGVKRAVEGSMKQIKENKKKNYCLGELVHNKQVIQDLNEKGIEFIENIDEIKVDNALIIIRAHGIQKNIYDKVKEKNINIIDYTCPNVLKIHKIAEEYQKQGYYILLTGTENHPEVIGITSFCGKNTSLIKDKEDIEKTINLIENSKIKNIIVISQTTYNSTKFDEIVYILKKKLAKDGYNLEIKKTICPATEIRQKETEDIAKEVDVMIIIGDKKSSNTNKLYDISSKYCTKVYFIQCSEELDIDKLKNINKIGIMAGASTPKEDINGVINILRNGGKNE